jgi:cytochrome P450 family 135
VSDSAIDSLPRAGAREVLRGLQTYFRPGTQRSPLHRLGERFVVDLPGAPTLLVTRSPEDARTMFADRDQSLSLGRALHRLTPHPVLFGGDSLIFLEGEAHVQERRRMGPAFHGERMRSYEQAMTEIAQARIGGWPTGRPVAFVELAQGFVLDVMRSVIFGVSEHERMRRLDRAMLDYCNVAESDAFLALGILGVLLTGRWRRYPPLERAAAAVDAIVLEEIAERRASGARREDDCLSLFLEPSEGEEVPKDDATLARDMRGLMLAGYETTAITLGWIAELLVHHPDVLARAQAAADAGDDAYLDAVIAEVMRLRPAFPFTGRRVVRDFDLSGLRVPRGAMLVISIMALHERPEIYPDPRAFRPERFLEARAGTYTWLPFGGGPHRCIGAAFALFESRVLLRTLLRQRVVRAAAPHGGRPRRTHPMLIPAGGARVVLAPRG